LERSNGHIVAILRHGCAGAPGERRPSLGLRPGCWPRDVVVLVHQGPPPASASDCIDTSIDRGPPQPRDMRPADAVAC